MTDRELLEAAAKAAGMDTPRYHDGSLGRGVGIGTASGPHSWKLWNPLANDGDALRLAVRVLPFHILQYSQEDYLACNQDGLAATRRAIVRAAAEIGKAMP